MDANIGKDDLQVVDEVRQPTAAAFQQAFSPFVTIQNLLLPV